MVKTIINSSLKNRLLVIFISVILIVGGIYISTDMEIDVLPDLTAPTVAILVDAHEFAPEEVEKIIALPIETYLNGATNVRRVRSTSSKGMCIVWVEFDWGTDIYRARQIVNEQLSGIVNQLPEGIPFPVIAPQTSIMGEIMLISLTSNTLDMTTLRSISDLQVKLRLMAVRGVSQIITIGGKLKQYEIIADQAKMQYYGVSLAELQEACRGLNQNVSGGFFNEYGQEYLINTIIRTTDTSEIGNSVVKMINKQPVKINDIARITISSAQKVGEGFLNRNPAIIMTVLKQPNTNTLALTEDIENAIIELQKTLPEGVNINSDIFSQADFISTSINNVLQVLMEGAIFATIILFFFLLNWRTTVISMLSIPISLIVAILTLKILGLTLNTMSLGGMAIAIGVLIDDAIVDVENVLKRLKQNYKLPKTNQRNILAVIFDASMEIRSSIIHATFIIIVAFVPLFFLSGMEGRLLRPLGITFIVSLFASLAVSLTLTPVLSSFLLISHSQLKRPILGGNKLIEKLNNLYVNSLRKMFRYRIILFSITSVLLGFSIFILLNFGRSFLPEFDEGTITITSVTMPGVSLDESNKINNLIDEELLALDEVNYVSRRTGRAELNEHSHGGTNASEIDVSYTLKNRLQEDFMQDIRKRVQNIQGISISIGQPIGHRIDHMLSGTRANIAIKVFGPDLSQLYAIANKINNNISDIEGLVDLNVEQLVEIPQIKIIPNRNMLAKYGITISQFTDFVDIAFGGHVVSQVFEQNQSFDLVLRFDEKNRNSKANIENSLIDTYDGQKIPLHAVAEVVSGSGPNAINHENVQRKIVVSANVQKRDVRSVVNDIKSIVENKIVLPQNFRIEYGGQFESAQKASRLLFYTSLLAILVIFLMLFSEFRSFKLAGIILLNLPLALIGGIFAILFSSNILSIPAIIGFITLFGIATRNGILLVSRYESLRKSGKSIFYCIINGSSERLNPILMTALTAAFALIPLAMRGHIAGNEIQSPMAVVIIGGLLSSVLLNLYIIPIVYYLIEKKENS
ncbi:MAG: efflux RND transporter permease subunit [Bacteroidetes bacterium]|jgi:CzcA family heavy metal efflux pump|nr:efflux RND transporter permease subunit [Bacteroidota bacterium]MBT6687549.1 efflux RND transporter permease subunit [Bacteroidota bacterium]MBT7142780.1 efflux RND transporter permease subunit [Bacteroidota bacterium]MBT7491983.1 efflux RND transporter permease subunit [Bacteroidota bacterium]